jgi:hypothetical protein
MLPFSFNEAQVMLEFAAFRRPPSFAAVRPTSCQLLCLIRDAFLRRHAPSQPHTFVEGCH